MKNYHSNQTPPPHDQEYDKTNLSQNRQQEQNRQQDTTWNAITSGQPSDLAGWKAKWKQQLRALKGKETNQHSINKITKLDSIMREFLAYCKQEREQQIENCIDTRVLQKSDQNMKQIQETFGKLIEQYNNASNTYQRDNCILLIMGFLEGTIDNFIG